MTNNGQDLINELMDNLQQMADDADSFEERNTLLSVAYLLQSKLTKINKQKKVKKMASKRAIGEVKLVVYKEIEEREDGMELVELDNRINPMLVNMNSLNLTMIDGSKEELEVLDIEIEWEVVVNKDGTDHSWFEDEGRTRHLRIAK